jgi:hypothetical protein
MNDSRRQKFLVDEPTNALTLGWLLVGHFDEEYLGLLSPYTISKSLDFSLSLPQ